MVCKSILVLFCQFLYIYLHDLLYYESVPGMMNAIDCEKQLKNQHKDWKRNLIKRENQTLDDIAADWYTDEEIKEYGEMLKRKGWKHA